MIRLTMSGTCIVLQLASSEHSPVYVWCAAISCLVLMFATGQGVNSRLHLRCSELTEGIYYSIYCLDFLLHVLNEWFEFRRW